MSKRNDMVRVWSEHANIGYIPNLYLDYNWCRRPSCLNERPEGESGYDWWGVHWTFDALTGMPNVTVDHPPVITDITKWEEQVTFPDLSTLDWEGSAAADTAEWDRENKVSVVMLINGAFERSHHLMGFEEAMIAMYEEPEAYCALYNRLIDYKCELLEYFAKYYKPDVMWMHDDYGASNTMLVSPEKWREIIKEPLARLVKTAHDNGLIYEHHTCGYIEPIVADMIEIGVDALGPVQTPCNDIERLKNLYNGKITFTGGFNSQGVLDHPDTNAEKIGNEMQHVYDILAPGGGYVSTPIAINMKGIAPAMIKKHLEIAKNYGDK